MVTFQRNSNVILRASVLLAAGLVAGFSHASGPRFHEKISVPDTSGVALLKLSYEIKCDDRALPALPGFVEYRGRRIRFELHAFSKSIEIILDTAADKAAEASVYLLEEKAPSCEVLALQTEVIDEPAVENDSVATLALRHAPFLVLRGDLIDKPISDVPLMMSYSWIPNPRKQSDTLRYTVFFSDQNASKEDEAGLRTQLGKWSRLTDIEWAYEIEFDRQGRIVSENLLQAWKVSNLSTRAAFREKDGWFQAAPKQYLDGSRNPILYIGNTHNAFSRSPDAPQKMAGLVGHHLVPRHRIDSPKARESVLLENPWMLIWNDLERKAEGRFFDLDSTQNLYVEIEAQGIKGSYVPAVEFDGQVLKADNSTHHGLDTSLWSRSTLITLPLTSAALQSINNQDPARQVTFRIDSSRQLKSMEIQKINFYILKQGATAHDYQMIDVTNHFLCLPKGPESFCVTKVN